MAEHSDPATRSSEAASAREGDGGLLSRLVALGPIFFGLGFVAPLVAQTLDAMGLEAPIAPSNLVFGLTLGLAAGLVAQVRGSWL